MPNGAVAGVGAMGVASIARSTALARVQSPRRNVNQLQRQAIVRPSFAVNPIIQALASGTQGVWVDGTDVSQMSSDLAGTVPAVLNGPIGSVKDKSGRSHAFASLNNAFRPVFSARINVLEGTSALATQTIATVASDYVLRFTGDGSVVLSGTASGTYTEGEHTVTATAGTLTVTVTGTVTDADLRLAIDTEHGWPVYQAVNTATDYDVDGFPRFLQFDGVDDRLVSSILQFDQSESATLFYAADMFTQSGRMAELSLNVGSINNTFGSHCTSGGYDMRVRTPTTIEQTANLITVTGGPFAAPDAPVITGRVSPGYVGAGQMSVRRNAEEVAFTQTAPIGPIQWVNDRAQTGGGATAAPFLRGRLYHMVMLGETISDQMCASVESFLASARQGVYV